MIFDAEEQGGAGQEFHERNMRIALAQAETAREAGEVPVGCVIISDGGDPGLPPARVLGKAHNQVEILKDPTAHAEILAITQAAEAIGDWRLTNTVLYVTKEPCPMCAGAIVLARIPKVVFGATDPKRGGAVSIFNILDNEALNHRCRVTRGIMEKECELMLKDFFREARNGVASG